MEDDYYRAETKQRLTEKIEQELLERRNKILAMKQARENEAQDFLKQKKIQQYM